VTVTGEATATVQGSVNPGGESTTYQIAYDLQSSDWCMSNGSSGSPANATTPQTLGFTDENDHDVSVDLNGLTAGADYCADLVATNSSGDGDGGQIPFSAGLPSVYASGVTATGASAATVDGSVNPSGQPTTYWAEYDVAGSDWCVSGGSSGSPANSTTPVTLGFADTTFHDVSVAVTGLSAGTTYCGQLVASNSSGSGYAFADELTFDPSAGASTNTASALGPTTAVVAGSVDPIGQTTTYRVEYDLASSDWCASGGFSGFPAYTTPPRDLAYTDATFHEVSAVLSGLTAGTVYCADVVASNASGAGDGGQLEFRTTVSPPAVTTGTATVASTGTVAISGTVNPNGLATNYHFEYGTGTSYGDSTAIASAGAGSTDQTVTVTLSGLSPNTTYHYRLVATNPGGTTNSPDRTFTTQFPPAVISGPATDVSAAAATLSGTINPNGLPSRCHFEYGTDTSYGASTVITNAGSGSGMQTVSAKLRNLAADTTYHYRLVATNSAGTTKGADHTFTTSTAPRPRLSRVSLATARFTASAGTVIRLTLAEPAKITVVISSEVAGHRVNGQCETSMSTGPSCTATRTRTNLSFAAVRGRNHHHLRLPALQPGRYVATLVARDAAGQRSRPVTVTFTITATGK
jgi:hypothetical protein